MGVDHRRRQAGVPQGFLRQPDVLSTTKQVGRECMPQRVRCHPIRLGYPGRQGLAFDQLAHVSTVELGTMPGGQQPGRGRSKRQPADDDVAKVIAEPDDPILGPLALSDQQSAGVEVDVLGPDGDHLATAQAALQHESHGEQVTKRGRVAPVELGQQRPLLVGRQDLGESSCVPCAPSIRFSIRAFPSANVPPTRVSSLVIALRIPI